MGRFTQQCRCACRRGDVNALKALFCFHAEKSMNAHTRHVKQIKMVEIAALAAAEFGMCRILDFLKTFSYYDLRMIPIDEVAVRFNQIQVLRWCFEHDFYLEKTLKNDLTLLGVALKSGDSQCALWLYNNFGPYVGNLFCFIGEIGKTLPFSTLLCEIIVEQELVGTFMRSAPHLATKGDASQVYKCASFIVGHRQVRDTIRIKNIEQFKDRAFRKHVRKVYQRQLELFEGWICACHVSRRRGVPMVAWMLVFEFSKGEPWDPRTLERMIRETRKRKK